MSCRVATMLECPKNTSDYVTHVSSLVSESINFTATIFQSISPTTTAARQDPTETLPPIHIGDKDTQAPTITAAFSDEIFHLLFLPYWCLALIAIMALSWRSSKSRREPPSPTPDNQTTKPQEAPRSSYEWVRPLGGIEFLMGVGGYNNTMNTVQAVWLSSRQEIIHKHVEKALNILVKRMPQLTLSIQRRGLKLWYKQNKKFVIDFQTTRDDPLQVYRQLLSTTYDMCNGPLWKARLVVLPKSFKEDGRHYNYALIFSIQHAITDGTTNMIICKEVVSMLNSILGDKSLDDTMYPIIPAIMDTIPHNAKFMFYFKYFCSKLSSTLIRDFGRIAYFNGILPRPTPGIRETRILNTEYTRDQTINLIKTCKQEKVTVHSCIVAATNLALFKTVQKRANYKLEKARIHLTNCINMRKFYDDKYQHASGCHISLEELNHKISLSKYNNFWDEARYVHTTLREHLADNLHVKVWPLLFPAAMIYSINEYFTVKKIHNRTDCHYVTTNMGDLTSLLPDSTPDDCVDITNILRSVTCESAGNPCMLTFHTFKGQFMLSLDYYTTKMTDEVAQEMFTTLKSYVTEIAETGTLSPSILLQ